MCIGLSWPRLDSLRRGCNLTLHLWLPTGPICIYGCQLARFGRWAFVRPRWNCEKSLTPAYKDTAVRIELSNVIGGRERAKHTDIRKHYAHEVIPHGHLRLAPSRVDTAKQLAGVKGATRRRFALRFHRASSGDDHDGRKGWWWSASLSRLSEVSRQPPRGVIGMPFD